MAGFNKMTIIGNLGADPEMRFTPSGSQVTSFRVAVTERRKQADGQTTETTLWFRVSCWNKLAEVANQYLHKGSKVYIEGPLAAREYTANDGQLRTSLEITAREFQILDSRGAMAEGGQPAAVGAGTSGRSSQNDFGSSDAGDDMDSIPF